MSSAPDGNVYDTRLRSDGRVTRGGPNFGPKGLLPATAASRCATPGIGTEG
jgi:hypothetical protein